MKYLLSLFISLSLCLVGCSLDPWIYADSCGQVACGEMEDEACVLDKWELQNAGVTSSVFYTGSGSLQMELSRMYSTASIEIYCLDTTASYELSFYRKYAHTWGAVNGNYVSFIVQLNSYQTTFLDLAVYGPDTNWNKMEYTFKPVSENVELLISTTWESDTTYLDNIRLEKIN